MVVTAYRDHYSEVRVFHRTSVHQPRISGSKPVVQQNFRRNDEMKIGNGNFDVFILI